MNLFQIFDLIFKTSVNQLFRIKQFNNDSLRYTRNTMCMYCFLSLLEIGFIDRLLKEGGINLEDFIQKNNFDRTKLSAICEYLYILKILDKQNNLIFLNKNGLRLFKNSVGTLYFYNAYSPIFENLTDLIRRKKKYKIDLFRKGDFVAKATAETSVYIPVPIIKSLIKKYKFKSVLDLGCGSGDFLISLSSENLLCYGIDISKEAINLARNQINQNSINHKVSVKVGDIFNANDLSFFKNVDVLTCMFVLHEFVYYDFDLAIKFLKNLKFIFPDKKLIVCEFMRFDSDFLRKNPSSIAEHHLFHALSEQGILKFTECSQIFELAGYKIIEQVRYDFAGQSYFVLS